MGKVLVVLMLLAAIAMSAETSIVINNNIPASNSIETRIPQEPKPSVASERLDKLMAWTFIAECQKI